MSQLNVGKVVASTGLQLPTFTSGTRPAGSEGLLIYNSTTKSIEGYFGTGWYPIAGGGYDLVQVKAWGAGGGSGTQNRASTSYHTNTYYGIKEGGAGGFVQATFFIQGGTSLIISPGGGGKAGLAAGNPSDAAGGFNGGGGGTYTTYDASGGGGGYSGIFIGSKTQENAILIAPGGGGGAGGPGYPAGSNDQANGGGGIYNNDGTGNFGTRANGYHVANAGGGSTTAGGQAGTSSATAAGQTGGNGAAGSALQGANAVHWRNVWGSGGGGGGGYYGGGSGSNDGNSWSGGGGGAGSAFVRESGISAIPTNSDLPAITYGSHSYGLQTYGALGDGSTTGYNSMRTPVGRDETVYGTDIAGNNIAEGGRFRLINQGGPAGFDGGHGLIAIKIGYGPWVSYGYNNSVDYSITIGY